MTIKSKYLATLNRITLIAFLLFVGFNALAKDFTEKETATIDSLRGVINNPNSHDTSLTWCYLLLSDIYKAQHPDTVITIAKEISLIVERGLSMKPSIPVKRSLFSSRAKTFYNLANVYMLRGNDDIALKFIQRSLKIFDAIGDTNSVGTCYNNIGNIYENKGKIVPALELYYQALRIHENYGDEIRITNCLQSIASIYVKQEKYTTALSYYKKCLELNQKTTNKRKESILLSSIGVVCHFLENYKKAISYYQRSLDIMEDGDISLMATNFDNIGAAYDELTQPEKALEFYNKGIEILERHNLESQLANSYVNISIVHYSMEQVENAKHFAEKGMSLSQKCRDPYLIEFAAHNLSIIETELGNYKEALKFYEIHIEMKDSIRNDKNLEAAIRKQAQYEFEKEEIKMKAALLVSNEKLRVRKIFTIAISLICLIILIYSIILYRKKRKEQELNKILSASNEVITKQKEDLESEISEREREEDAYYFSQSAIQVKFDQIIMLESSRHYVLVHVVGKNNPLLERVNMTDLIENFPTTLFVKVHRSYYINLNHIISRPSKYIIKMSNDMVINASRSYAENLGDKFMN